MPSSKTKDPPWMDSIYRKERVIRRKLEKQWKRQGTSASKESYVKQRDYCVSFANYKMKTYYSGLSASTNNPNILFKKVTQLWNIKKVKALPDGYSNYFDMAYDFNTFFSSKINDIRQSLINEDAVLEPPEDVRNTDSATNLCDFDPTTLQELKEILSEMKIKTSFDDPLPVPLLEASLSILLPHIKELVNLSLSIGNIDGLKESIINPILKKMTLDKNIKNNFRPIVNLQFLSKLIEKVVLR